MPSTATLTNGECAKHSGVCDAIVNIKEALKDHKDNLREALDDQDKINVRMFERLDRINAKLSWLIGGVSVLGILLTLIIGAAQVCRKISILP